jgi:hypothetical protein
MDTIDTSEMPVAELDSHGYMRENGGGKAGAYAHILEKNPQLHAHLPPNTIHYRPADGSKENLLNRLQGEYPKIVRPCHPRDAEGLAGIMPHAIAQTRDEVSRAIDGILEFAESEEFKTWFIYEFGVPYDGNASVLVQDWCGKTRGSIIEHPHHRGVFRINRIVPTDDSRTFATEDVCRSDGHVFDLAEMSGNRSREPIYKTSKRHHSQDNSGIIELYKQIAETGIIPGNISFQMEFGFDAAGRAFFYQARQFRRFETSRLTDPIPPRGINETRYTTLPYNCFGIYGGDGKVTMAVADLYQNNVRKNALSPRVAYQYSSGALQPLPATVLPQNMEAYLTDDAGALARGHFRWMQKAVVTLLGIPAGKIAELEASGANVSIHSDGIQGVICSGQ